MNILTDLKKEFGEIFIPDLEQIFIFYREDKVWYQFVFSQKSGKEAIENDLSFMVYDSESIFKTEYTLEGNAQQLLNLDNKSLLMVIGEVLTEEGADRLLEGNE